MRTAFRIATIAGLTIRVDTNLQHLPSRIPTQVIGPGR